MKIAVVGIGNELCKDDGFGLLALRELEKRQISNITLLEGRTCGISLHPLFFEYDRLIFLDIIKTNDKPGSIYVIPAEKLNFKTFNAISFHDIGIESAYETAKMLGAKSKAYILGIVPYDINGYGEISPLLVSKVKEYLEILENLLEKIFNGEL